MSDTPSRLRVLVFNWHEAYICLFAHTHHYFCVVPPQRQPNKRWDSGSRPLPSNAEEVTWEQAQSDLRQGRYDLVLCLALYDLQTVQHWEVPRLFVMLNMVGTDTALSGKPAEKAALVERFRPLFSRMDIAFISEKKRRDWGWEAPVVVSGIDPDLYGGYTGELARVLRVGNYFKERDHMQGFSAQEAILGGQFPSAVIGLNPTVPGARHSTSWEDLKEQYRRHRLLLSALTEIHEDGYNLGMLEAMATGMPVVSTPNSTSPIIDGHNGFIANDHQILRERIKLLLAAPDLAAELGRNARQTVVERFHIRDFIAGWNQVFAQCVERRGVPQGAAPWPPAPSPGRRRLKILLAAPANPLSTSAYYERALRRGHEVLTCGPRLDERTLGQWKQWEDQHALKPPGSGDVDKMGLLARLVQDSDIPLPWGRVGAEQVAAQLPKGWRPDLVLWVDAGPEFLLEEPRAFGCPAVALVGDTHTGQLPWRADYARAFDQVFLMFARQHIPEFVRAGCPRVGWLPAACEPQIHRCFGAAKAYDVVFAGQTLRQWHPDRVRFLERLQAAGFDLRVESKILEEMALLFSRGRLVFNRSLNGDLNMRVFEALSCGSLLLTDRLPAEAGLEELFADRQHLVLYGEEDLEELARYYLEHEDEREKIAAAGCRLALERHTYGHRADQVLEAVFGRDTCASCVAKGQEPERPAAVAAAPARARVSLVIPLFNKAELTEQCLLGVARNTGNDQEYEVVAVDNGSTDWTVYLLPAFEGDIRVLRNEENLGFAWACNQGVEAATGEYVVLLNNDTVPQPGWLEAMVRLADSDPLIGVVGALLLYPGSGKVQHAGLEMVKGLPEHVYRGAAADDPRVLVQRDLDMVTGACMLVRRELFLQLGGLDAAYVNGVEDVDFCLRVRQAGYRVVYCPECVVEHHEGASEGRFDRVRENLLRFQQQWGHRFDAQGRFRAAPAAGRPLRGNWEGAFLVHSSLAHANGELVRALLAEGDCELGLLPSEPPQWGGGELAGRLGQGLAGEVDFHLRHRWPPDFSRPASGKLVLIQPWEFGRIPQAWLGPLEQVDQVWAYTRYVRQCYLDSGVPAAKVKVVPLGVDPGRFRPGLQPLPLATGKPFRFLFVGGTLFRKGIDVLLKAYVQTFSAADWVCLVIKDMGVQSFYRNQHAGDQIRRLQHDPANPEILYLTEDLPEGEMPRLYAACDCLVHPYRGEGFGLPVAEALACGLPAILTRGGACDDFCPEEMVYWVEAQRRQVRFEQETAGPAWLLEPDLEGLKERLRQVYGDPEAARRRGQRASAHIHAHFTWAQAAQRARKALAELVQSSSPSGEEQAPLHLQEADRCRQRGDWHQAALACEKAVAVKPDFVEAIMVWADALIEADRPDQAAGVIARLVELDPRSSMAHNYLGLVQSKARQWEAAGASFRRALELQPLFPEALFNLGVWAWEQGRGSEALGYFKEAAGQDPANRELVANLALLHLKVGQPAEAAAALRHFLGGHPDEAELQAQLAEVLWQQGDREGSREAALKVLALQPDHQRAGAIAEQTGGKRA
ncbi:MAG: glycosyltransferase [Candidatus Handelsmanbacteria bacterium]|nr:glycosyltransferase [Candidatus Handelsmanbacteria bacterium]